MIIIIIIIIVQTKWIKKGSYKKNTSRMEKWLYMCMSVYGGFNVFAIKWEMQMVNYCTEYNKQTGNWMEIDMCIYLYE